MSKYSVKEIYYTLQGEGHHAGRPAVFCRFSGCNLWTGREEDRHKAICQFCDTDFWGTDGINGGKYDKLQLTETIKSLWPDESKIFAVFTGGEPALQLDTDLIDVLHDHNIEIAIETNGTISLPKGIDWICMSPKANTIIEQTSGDELKVVYPQEGIDPKDYKGMDFKHFYLQPMDSPQRLSNTEACIAYCKSNPQWKLSIQSHKYLDIP